MQEFVRLLRGASRILVFTGAGISTGSGIPDFRGPQGVWKRRQPVYYDEFLSSPAKRTEYWDYKLEGYEGFMAARPNPAHRALVRLEELGKLELLVTQNVDGLHHAAGHSEDLVVELHGTNRLVSCLACGFEEPPQRAFEAFRLSGEPPVCPECGAWLKPATISFGQSMPGDKLDRCFDAAGVCDPVVSLGSTLSVEPAASVPAAAATRGVPYVVVNQGPTSHDRLATVRLEGDLCELLPAVMAGLGDGSH